MHVFPRARFQAVLLAASWGAALTAMPAQAADYYAGKTIEFVVGDDVGGGYDIYARAVARHIARHIPGNPNTIVRKNMPGAGTHARRHLHHHRRAQGRQQRSAH